MNDIIAELMGEDVELFEEMAGENMMWVLSNDREECKVQHICLMRSNVFNCRKIRWRFYSITLLSP